MTATNHALTGAVIALTVKQPWLAIPLAFLAHFAMDVIPHFDLHYENEMLTSRSRNYWKILISDLALASILLVVVPILKTGTPMWVIFASMLACVLPDIIWGFRLVYEIVTKKLPGKSWFTQFHKWIQWSETPRGAIIEVVWFFLMAGLVCSI